MAKRFRFALETRGSSDAFCDVRRLYLEMTCGVSKMAATFGKIEEASRKVQCMSCSSLPRKSVQCHVINGRWNSRVGIQPGASDRKARCSTNRRFDSLTRRRVRFIPTVHYHLYQCRHVYGVRTAPVCTRMHQHLYALTLKSQTLAAIGLPLFEYCTAVRARNRYSAVLAGSCRSLTRIRRQEFPASD